MPHFARIVIIAFALVAASCSAERAQQESARKETGRQLTAAYLLLCTDVIQADCFGAAVGAGGKQLERAQLTGLGEALSARHRYQPARNAFSAAASSAPSSVRGNRWPYVSAVI
jgi:hypothetical protein